MMPWRDHSLQQRLYAATLVLAVVCLIARDIEVTVTSKTWQSASQTNSITTTTCKPIQNIDALNNQTYTWYGNQWMPPMGVPLYTREDMINAFSQFDTLWIGDSTTRRAYATVFALLNANKSLISVKDLNHPRVIDVNKRAYKGIVDEDSCGIQHANAEKYLQLGMTNIWTRSSLCRQLHGRSFDYIRADCFKEIIRISRLHWDLKRYSLVIIGVGIHDLLIPRTCSIPLSKKKQEMMVDQGSQRQKTNQMPVEEILSDYGLKGAQEMANILELVHRTNNTTPTAVLWRTTGFDSSASQDITETILRLNNMGVAFIQNKTRIEHAMGKLMLVDWGAAVWPRSFPPDRIEGDLGAHYGLETRLLMAQMTMQQLDNVLKRSKVNHSSANVELATVIT